MENVGKEHNEKLKTLLKQVTKEGWTKESAIADILKWGRANGDTFNDASYDYVNPLSLLDKVKVSLEIKEKVKVITSDFNKCSNYS